jgi:D-serine deaminase-like pyridoxal phosphate-dependent protein
MTSSTSAEAGRAEAPARAPRIAVPAEVETPALVIDLDIFEANLDEMAEVMRAGGMQLMPHTKTHRTPALAMMQLARGAAGLTAATVDEVEALVAAGAERIYMAYPLVGDSKIRRILALPPTVRIAVSIDSIEGARAIGARFAEQDREAELYLMVDSGLRRAGVEPADAPGIAAEIDRVEGVRLSGLMTHDGWVYGSEDDAALVAQAHQAAKLMVDTAAAINAVGPRIESVSLGSSGSARALSGYPGVTELRPGIYAFNDLSQVGIGLVDPSRCAARVEATVISHPVPDRACIDAGSKVLSRDLPPGKRPRELYPGFGVLVGLRGWQIPIMSEEHGWLRWVGDGEPTPLPVGTRVQIIPNHICTVFSSVGQSVGVRNGEVVGIWPVLHRATTPLARPLG